MAIVPITPGIDERVILVDTTGSPIGSVGNPLNVTATGGGSGGTSAVDAVAWTTGVSSFNPGGGVFNDSAAALASGTQGTLRMTPNRAQHVNLRTQAGAEITSFGGVSVVDAAAWTTAVSSFCPGGGVFNDSAAALTSGQQGTQRLTAQRGAHVNLRSTAGADVLLTHNNAAPAALSNLGVLSALANAAVPTFTEGDQTLLSLNLAGALRAAAEGPTAVGVAITRPPVVIAGQNGGNVKLMSLSSGGAILLQGTLSNNNAAPGADFIENLGALANAAAPTYIEGNSVMLSVDLGGRMRVTGAGGTFPTTGSLTNNNAAPGATNSGALSALANATAPTWTEGNQVLASVTLKGDQRVLAGGYTPAAPTATFTRGANTTAYTIGDEVGTASTAPTTVAVGRFNGGSGVIQGAQVVYSSYAATVPQLVVLLFSATVTLAGDNAQLNLSDSDAALLIGVIPLTMAQSGQYSAGAPVAAGNTIFAGAPASPIQFTCGASQTTIYACIITLNAWTPIANSETLALSLRVEGN